VLQGAGIMLTVDGVAHACRVGDLPLAFRGEAVTACRLLDGPTRDLNLMLHGAEGGMSQVIDGAPWQPRARQCGLFTQVAGHCRCDGQTIAVPEHALLWFEQAPEALVFVGGGAAAGPPGWWLAADAAKEPAP
jgi:environmental stress-induced protein Ves